MKNSPEVVKIVDVQGKLAGKETEVGILTGEEAGNVTEDVASVDVRAQRSNRKLREQQRLGMIKTLTKC